MVRKSSPPRRCIDRRTVLKSAGVISSVGLVGSVSADDTVTITTAKHGEAPLVYKEVPTEWRAKALKSRELTDALHRKYSGQQWYAGIRRQAGTERIDGHAILEVVVLTSDRDSGPEDVPSRSHGVPISVEEVTPSQELESGYCTTNGSTCVQGGSYVESDVDPFSAGILGELDGRTGLFTCAHGFINNICNDIQGESLWSGEDKEYRIGSIEKEYDYDWENDWAFVTMDGSSDIDGFDNSIKGSRNDVRGHETRSGFEEMCSNNESLHQYGAATCSSSTTTYAEEYQSYCRWSDKWISHDLDTDQGDSGSPYWREYEEYDINSIVGFHQGDYGSLAWRIDYNTDKEVKFGGSSTC